MKTKIGFIFGIVVLFTLVNFGSLAVAFDSDAKTLRGFKGVRVLVGSLEPEIEKEGLTVQQIQTDVELKLRLAGIKVLTKEEWSKEKGAPFLLASPHLIPYVLKVGKRNCRLYIFNINLTFRQNAYLEKELPGPVSYSSDKAVFSSHIDMTFAVVTWSVGTMGRTANLNKIRNEINDLVDEFINAYLSVNPK